ncbi:MULTISPECIES: LCP family protein [unclassified Roseburia]|jgi:LCP family protein required for cell wall assembly|nr:MULTISPECIES: LCP family protein [unclassified Roseburia]RHQ42936.1 LytR family transcriptional regulator [Roseburia sp. AF25-18LB]RHQ49715.1 LytR family transcriptional regulator [Roseburia sp. AF25-15LB]RHQ51048.1 LytR family transcriptional regulator [Roseburia sp. AF25-13LB]
MSTSSNNRNRKRKKMTRRQRRKRKLMLFIVEVLVILILLAALFVIIKLNKLNNTGDLDEDKLNINIDAKTQELLDGYTNIALFGIDNRSTGKYESGNSDCIMIASINNDTKEVRLISVYRDSFLAVDDDDDLRKLNAAYAKGGPTGAVAALNKNLDLDIKEYVAVDFNAVMEVVDALGGIELDISSKEAETMKIYINEMNEVMGTNGTAVSGPGLQTVNGIQALAYCRDRYSGGDDYGRTERQRTVISKIVEKAKAASLPTLNKVIDELFPDISTSLSSSEILGLAAGIKDYELADTQGWPFQLTTERMGGKLGDVVVPTDLETNVNLLHQYLFDVEDYETTQTVKNISKSVINETGKTASDTVRDTNPFTAEDTEADTQTQ